MNINYIEYSILTKSLDIFFAGCNNRCEDCCNPELMSFENGTPYKEWLPKIKHYIEQYGKLIERVFLVGGSPTHQNIVDMQLFLEAMKMSYPDLDIYLFCGEELDTVPHIFKTYCDYIKCGAYIPSLTCNDNVQYGIKLATSNQRILRKGQDY